MRLAEALAIEGQEWVPSPHLFLGCGPTVCVNQVQESLLGPLLGSPPAEWRITRGFLEGGMPGPTRTHPPDEATGCPMLLQLSTATIPAGEMFALMILEHLSEEGVRSLQTKRPEETVRGSPGSGEAAHREAACGATACKAALL